MAATGRFKTLYANTSAAVSDPCLHRLVPSTPTSSTESETSSVDRPTSPSHSVTSSQCSSLENVNTPDRSVQTEARRSILGRQIHRSLWQPDREAEVCSILACQTKFAEWSLLKSQRHHCRLCGRVVCHTCSTGTRLLLPPRGEKGPARAVRVCDACLTNNETYNFCASPKAGTLNSPSTAPPPTNVKNGSPPTGALEEGAKPEDAAPTAVTPKQQAAKTVEEKPLRPSMFRSNSAPSLVKLAETADANPGTTNEDVEDILNNRKAAAVNTVPVQVPNKRSSARATTTKDLMEGMGEVDERVRRVQNAFAASSYYHGLLQHEPDALRMLILAEASQETAQASNA